MKFTRCSQVLSSVLPVALTLAVAVPGLTQTAAIQLRRGQRRGVNASLEELQSQVRELKDMVLQLQQQTTASRAEISHLRQELEAQHDSTGAESALDEPSPGSLFVEHGATATSR